MLCVFGPTFIDTNWHDLHQHRRFEPATLASSAACMTRSAGGQMSGGKGKNPFPGPFGGGKEFPVFPAGRAAQDRVVLLGSGALAG